MIALRLRTLPAVYRVTIAAFILVSLAGYVAGLAFVYHNTGMAASGISDHYHGNEEELKFGKSTAEMLGIVHTHLLGMGSLFFLVALLYAITDGSDRVKTFWAAETLLSLLTTFGSLWLIAAGWHGMVWLLYPSSVLMVIGYLLMSFSVLWHSLTPRSDSASALSGR
jgi:hypothetical protein